MIDLIVNLLNTSNSEYDDKLSNLIIDGEGGKSFEDILARNLNELDGSYLRNTVSSNVIDYFNAHKQIDDIVNQRISEEPELFEFIDALNETNVYVTQLSQISRGTSEYTIEDLMQGDIFNGKLNDFSSESFEKNTLVSSTQYSGINSSIEIALFPDGSFKLYALGNLEQSLVTTKQVIERHHWDFNFSKSISTMMASQSDSIRMTSNKLHTFDNENTVSFKNNLEQQKTEKPDFTAERLKAGKISITSEWVDMLRKLTLLNNGDETQVYLRDYHLTSQERQRVISDLTSAFNQQTKISKIVVNGEIFTTIKEKNHDAS